MKRFTHCLVLVSLPLLLHAPPASSAAFDAFLEIAGIPGESTKKGHEQWIEIESFSFGASNPAIFAAGGAQSGKVQFQDFHFSKNVDMSSPLLMLATATGKHFSEAIFDVVSTGSQQAYLRYTMENVFVTSYTISGSGIDNSVPTDQFGLNFAKIHFEYRPFRDDGSLGDPIRAGWDLKHATPAPEPSTWAMLVAGLAFVAYRGRRMINARTA
jgi:type VI secretion system secreted protein Hcp